jgi:hypothetical protein
MVGLDHSAYCSWTVFWAELLFWPWRAQVWIVRAVILGSDLLGFHTGWLLFRKGKEGCLHPDQV